MMATMKKINGKVAYGYYSGSSYIGMVNYIPMEFVSEEEYYEYLREQEDPKVDYVCKEE